MYDIYLDLEIAKWDSQPSLQFTQYVCFCLLESRSRSRYIALIECLLFLQVCLLPTANGRNKTTGKHVWGTIITIKIKELYL